MTKTRIILFSLAGFVLAVSGLMLIINALSPAESARAFPPTHTPQPTTAQTLAVTPVSPQSNTIEDVLPVQESQAILLPETILMDEQGAIIVEITPLNSSEARNTLNFKVTLTTHSIDLSMDLATLATLTTDNGMNISAILWDAPRGGHHLEGILSFAAYQEDVALLAGATKLTLTINNLDAPVRTFTWDM